MEQDIRLFIQHGFVLKSLDDKGVAGWAQEFRPEKFHHERLGSIQSMSLADLHDLASASIQSAFNINTEKCRKENGGKGLVTEIFLMVDVDDKKDEVELTRMSIPNENSWEACKHLVGVAKGTVQVVYRFAVDKGTFMDRFLLHWLI